MSKPNKEKLGTRIVDALMMIVCSPLAVIEGCKIFGLCLSMARNADGAEMPHYPSCAC